MLLCRSAITWRSATGAVGLALSIALALWCAPKARADAITFMSASPYQLGDLLRTENPTYDVEINAELVHPAARAEVKPAFVFVHGSGGRLLRHQRYLELARSLGFVTLQLDSFGPRGVSSTVGNQTNVTAAMMTVDVLRALAWLAARPDVDARRIAVMGSSKGAIAALFAAWSPIRQKVVTELDFAGYALLYPLCARIEDATVTASPVHVFIGEKDNWTPAAPCIAEVERMRARGRPWAITLYDGAFHGFDAPIEGIRDMPHAYSMAGCDIALRADGYEYETGSGYLLTQAERRQAFRACARKGGVKMGGYHAAGALLTDVERFLRVVRDRD